MQRKENSDEIRFTREQMFGTDFKILEELSIHQYWDGTN